MQYYLGMSNTHTITWKTGAGKTATVTVELQTERHLGTVHGEAVTKACCELVVTASVEGMGTVGSGRPQPINHPAVTHGIGKLGIPAAPLAEILAAINEVEASPEWQAQLERETQGRIDCAEYEAHRARMQRHMQD